MAVPPKLKQYVKDGLEQLEQLPRRDQLHRLLAWALGYNDAESSMNSFRSILEGQGFVTMPGVIYEMLMLVERYYTGRPIILESLTGCGKTYKLALLASLMNDAMTRRRENQFYVNIKEEVSELLHAKLVMHLDWDPPVETLTWLQEIPEPDRFAHLLGSLGAGRVTDKPQMFAITAALAAIGDPGEWADTCRDFARAFVDNHPILKPSKNLMELLRNDAEWEAQPVESIKKAIGFILGLQMRPLVYRMLVHPDLSPNEVRSYSQTHSPRGP